MATGYATVNLGLAAAKSDKRERKIALLPLLLRFEAWLDRRATRRALYGLDDHELADIGLSRADVERLNASSWSDYLPPPLGR